MTWLIEGNIKFSVIGNTNAITYNEVFPHIVANEVWLGRGFHAGNAFFAVGSKVDYAKGVYDEQTGLVKFRNSCWFSNIDHGRRHEPMQLMTEADNIKYSKHKEVRGIGYAPYDNFDGIEVPYIDAIPSDYEGMMGVPITFLDKYNPDQFEILGSSEGDFPQTKTYSGKQKVVDGVHMKSNTGSYACYVRVDEFGPGTFFDVGYPVKRIYKRLFIRRKGA